MIKLIVVGRQWPKSEIDSFRTLSFSSTPHLVDMLKDHIEFEDFDPTKTYDPGDIFLAMVHSYLDPVVREQFSDCKVIVDLCREAMMEDWNRVYYLLKPGHVIMYGSQSDEPVPNVIFVPNFMWYNESLENTIKGRDSYVPNRNYSRKFLMPIGRKNKIRDQVVEFLDSQLEDSYWSYVRRNKALPGESESVPGAKRWDTRYQNPIWYDDTCFSLVIESVTSWKEKIVPMLTEKLYKPIAYQHPFMVIGAAGILKYLRSQGFETFENLFDESYDEETALEVKLDIILRNIENFEKTPYSELTQQKLQHNHELFYNRSVIQQSMIDSIVRPIEEFINLS